MAEFFESTSFYLSGGDLNLTIFASFEPRTDWSTGPGALLDSFTGSDEPVQRSVPLVVRSCIFALESSFGLIGYKMDKVSR